MHRGRTRGLAGAAVLLIALSACGDGDPADVGNAQTPQQTRAQYWDEAKRLSLAPGWEWPPRAPEGVQILDNDPDDGAGNSYSPGYGRSWANDYWFCSWQDRLLTQGLAEKELQTALKMAKKIRQTHRYKNSVDDDGRRRYDEMLRNAGLGDLSDIRSDFNASCQSMRNP